MSFNSGGERGCHPQFRWGALASRGPGSALEVSDKKEKKMIGIKEKS